MKPTKLETMRPEDKAKELGARVPIEGGISWIWSRGLPSEDAAVKFVEWLNQNGYEHRGVYPDEQHPTVSKTFSVRWR